MKTIAALSAAALTLVGAASVATPGFARDYGYRSGVHEACRVKQKNGQTAGALIGGLAGAVLGSNVAGRGDRTEGAVIGGVAGALIGNSIGRSSAKSSYVCDARDARYSYRNYGYRDYRYSAYRY